MLFDSIITSTTRVSRADYLSNYGGLIDDLAQMNDSPFNRQALADARSVVDDLGARELAGGLKRLLRFDFGDRSLAPELQMGKVAAIDGTFILPMQKNTFGNMIVVGVASNSYARRPEESMHAYSTRIVFETSPPTNSAEFVNRLSEELEGIFPTAYMRYFEAVHALEIDEPYVLCDGALVTEWLANTSVGRDIYLKLLGQKRAIGVMKGLKDNKKLGIIGRVLRPGELVIYETLEQHLNGRAQAKANSDRLTQWKGDGAFSSLVKKIWRGAFKPSNKAYGFECHEDHLDPMLRILAADAFVQQPGHSIPYLLHAVDQFIRNNFAKDGLQAAISARLAASGDDLFFDETDEIDFR